MKVHQSLQKEQESLKLSSAGVERKFQRKLSELQEVRELDLQAKTHMEDSFRVMVEEKEEKINVLQMQVGREEREVVREGKRERETHQGFIQDFSLGGGGGENHQCWAFNEIFTDQFTLFFSLYLWREYSRASTPLYETLLADDGF